MDWDKGLAFMVLSVCAFPTVLMFVNFFDDLRPSTKFCKPVITQCKVIIAVPVTITLSLLIFFISFGLNWR